MAEYQYWGLEADGELVSAQSEEIFIKWYESNWATTLSDTYFKGEQFDVGHRIRPRLVYWGFLFSVNDPSALKDVDFDAIAKVAVSIELIHKSSLIIDDFIDKDVQRHGKPTLYSEVGAERAIVYSLNILGKALQIINQVFFEHPEANSKYFESMKSIMSTLQSMTLGVLKELDLEKEDLYTNAEKIREIMQLETSSLLTNSLLLGYYLNNFRSDRVCDLFRSIGDDFGFIFQALNDLEPFCSQENVNHKGQLNTDFSRNRKNICIPILFIFLTESEKRLIQSASDSNSDNIALSLFRKYGIQEIMLSEIMNSFEHVVYSVNLLIDEGASKIWVDSFIEFLTSVYRTCLSRLGI